jgi:hypothetical protein
LEAETEIAGYCYAVFAYHGYAGAAIYGVMVSLNLERRGSGIGRGVLIENGELCWRTRLAIELLAFGCNIYHCDEVLSVLGILKIGKDAKSSLGSGRASQMVSW